MFSVSDERREPLGWPIYRGCAISSWSACLGQRTGGVRRELGWKGQQVGSKDVHPKCTALLGAIEGPDPDTPAYRLFPHRHIGSFHHAGSSKLMQVSLACSFPSGALHAAKEIIKPWLSLENGFVHPLAYKQPTLHVLPCPTALFLNREGCWRGALGMFPTTTALLDDPVSQRHQLGEIPSIPACLLCLPKAMQGC